MSFNELKRSRGGFDKLQSALEKDSESTKSFSDDRYWKPELDKSGNGYAVLRFLPAANGEELHGSNIGIMDFKVQVDGLLISL